jgi:hypothetical protein
MDITYVIFAVKDGAVRILHNKEAAEEYVREQKWKPGTYLAVTAAEWDIVMNDIVTMHQLHQDVIAATVEGAQMEG